MKISIVMVFLLIIATTAFSAAPGDISGLWISAGGDSWLELFPCGDKICGKIVWLKVPRYIDSNDGPIGKTKVDRKNPEPALRNRPIIGLQIIRGLTAKGANRWENGSCYNPESGKRYSCSMKLVSPARLELRGYIGISLIGRTFSLTR